MAASGIHRGEHATRTPWNMHPSSTQTFRRGEYSTSYQVDPSYMRQAPTANVCLGVYEGVCIRVLHIQFRDPCRGALLLNPIRVHFVSSLLTSKVDRRLTL